MWKFPWHNKTMTPNLINLVISWFDLNGSDDVESYTSMWFTFQNFTYLRWIQETYLMFLKLEQFDIVSGCMTWHLFVRRFSLCQKLFRGFIHRIFNSTFQEMREIEAQNVISSILIVPNEQLSLHRQRFRVRNLFLCYQDLT